MLNRDLKNRIIELSYKYKLAHLGSCLISVDIIDKIYSIKHKEDKFILSSGHAGLALYVVIEKYEKINAEAIWLHHGTHPDRCYECKIHCSSGSLGHGLPISLGMAIANPDINYYCLVSDGECAEGSIWETLRIWNELNLNNLNIYFNHNGFGAYKKINSLQLISVINKFTYRNNTKLNHCITENHEIPFLNNNLSDHYHIINDLEYEAWIKNNKTL
jgi:transketolase